MRSNRFKLPHLSHAEAAATPDRGRGDASAENALGADVIVRDAFGFDDSALKVAGGRPSLGGDLKFRKLESGRDRAAAQGV
jgi:hypothetical protein